MMRRNELDTELLRLERIVPVLSRDRRIPADYWKRRLTELWTAGANTEADVRRLEQLWWQIQAAADTRHRRGAHYDSRRNNAMPSLSRVPDAWIDAYPDGRSSYGPAWR
jgi:hypothetical protein